MFGQYGILEKNSTPWADAYIVDVPANVYAPRGAKQFTSSQPVEPGTSALGALLIALSDNQPQRKQYRIDHLRSRDGFSTSWWTAGAPRTSSSSAISVRQVLQDRPSAEHRPQGGRRCIRRSDWLSP